MFSGVDISKVMNESRKIIWTSEYHNECVDVLKSILGASKASLDLIGKNKQEPLIIVFFLDEVAKKDKNFEQSLKNKRFENLNLCNWYQDISSYDINDKVVDFIRG